MRRLRRKVARQERAIRLRVEMLELLEQLEHPLLLAPPASDSPTPTSEPTPPPLDLPPPLTEAEIQQLRELPMPDPLEEIEAALGMSTSPRSPQTWAG